MGIPLESKSNPSRIRGWGFDPDSIRIRQGQVIFGILECSEGAPTGFLGASREFERALRFRKCSWEGRRCSERALGSSERRLVSSGLREGSCELRGALEESWGLHGGSERAVEGPEGALEEPSEFRGGSKAALLESLEWPRGLFSGVSLFPGAARTP